MINFLNQYEPNVKATIAFLKLLNIKVNGATVNETLQNHPDYPSFLCISDSLNKWKIPNGAGKIEPEKIDELPVPFITHTNNREFPLAIVSETNDKDIYFYTKNYSKPIIENKKDFLKRWTGVYLIAEPNEHSGEKDYEQHKRKALIKSLVPVSLFILLTGFSFLLLYSTINKNLNSLVASVPGIYFQYLLLFAGIIMTALLLWYEIDKNNPLLKKVCTGIAKGNCNAILTSKKSKVFSWLSWSEVGFFYFTGNFLVLLFSGNNIRSAASLLGLLNILALPYIVFSVYYQWRVAKQWCVLCLAVQTLLLLGGINILSNNLLASFSDISVSFLINAFFIYSLPVLLWYTTKPFVLHLQERKNIKREYLRIKFNTEIFETLLKKQKQITLPVDDLGIDIGNPTSVNTLIKVCNPYCDPCSKAHLQLDELLKEIHSLKMKIIFMTPNDEAHHAIKPTRHLMAIASLNDERILRQSLDDWYLSEKKDYDLFASKYPMNGKLMKQGSKIAAMKSWCNTINITFTPTIFINGYQLPNVYSIEDLQYFLAE